MAFQLCDFQLFDNNGEPLSGGQVSVYEAGTTNEKDSFPTADDADAGTNPNLNPVVLDSAGRGQIWGVDGESYKLVIKTSAGVTLETIDDITSHSQQNAIGYYQATGSANAQVVTASPAWQSYVTGSILTFQPVADNTQSCTLNVNGLGAKSIQLEGGNNLYPGAIQADYPALVQFDGSLFILLNPATLSGSYTATATGMTTSPTTTVRYIRRGNRLSIRVVASITGTSNSTAFTLTGAPSSIVPSATAGFAFARVVDSGSTMAGLVTINTSGALEFSSDVAAGAFTASGTKGVGSGSFELFL